MQGRSYRGLFVLLALLGLTLDLGSKYGMFRWLYNEGQIENRGRFKTYPGVDGRVIHGEYDVWNGVFMFTAEFDPATPPSAGAWNGLQTWSAPVMPRVNFGALFGLGSEHKGLANGLFAVVCVIAAIAIGVWMSRRGATNDAWLCTALGLICAGTLGNFYDRVVFGGVRDFLHFYAIRWPVFNIADCCLVVGAAILLVQAMFTKPESTQEPRSVTTVPT